MTMKKTETIAYLAMNNWKQDGKEWVHGESNEKHEMQKALSAQKCFDAISILKREGWEVSNPGNGGMRTTKLKDPQTKRVLNVNKAISTQKERGWTPYNKAIELSGMSVEDDVKIWCPYCGELHVRAKSDAKNKSAQCSTSTAYSNGFSIKISVEMNGEEPILHL
jgi:hypothetical protein